MSNHYERAFAAYLRSRRVSTISVEETRRTFVGTRPIKSLDFIVVSPQRKILLIDLKGRRVRRLSAIPDAWVTEDDVAGMRQWRKQFGAEAEAMFVFACSIDEIRPGDKEESSIFSFGDRKYIYFSISHDDYESRMRVRSRQWKTVTVRKVDFLNSAKPFEHWLAPEPSAAIDELETESELRLSPDHGADPIDDSDILSPDNEAEG